MGKNLVAFFSASGVTAKAAQTIAEIVGADLYEIKPSTPYTDKDLDWTNKNSRSSIEMNNPDCRPEILEKAENMEQYDTVFLGFPIWWYREPSIIDTFLESYDFSKKKIIPFATSGGSGFGNSEKGLHSLVSKDVSWEKGHMVNSATEQDVENWINTVL
ncbi:flavodoxin [Enterocloster bolteae]|uniref:flavodoxin n=1 Tax=Enterocloster bolteae TaxID=208479 RepID=UPI0028DC1719|nr:flavodoxin [Enterocloster bolteae]